MPVCPNCEYEYEPFVQKCSDCLIPLVDQLPERKSASDEPIEWVPVHAFQGPVLAEMAKSLLEQNDIPALVQKHFLSSAYGASGTGPLSMDTQVLVPRQDLGRARQLIAEFLDKPE